MNNWHQPSLHQRPKRKIASIVNCGGSPGLNTKSGPGNWSFQQHSSNLPAWAFLRRHRNSYYMFPWLNQFPSNGVAPGNSGPLFCGQRPSYGRPVVTSDAGGHLMRAAVILESVSSYFNARSYWRGITSIRKGSWLSSTNKQSQPWLSGTGLTIFGIRVVEICNVIYGGLEPNPNGNHTRCVIVVVNSGELFTAIDPPSPLSGVRVREFGNPRGYLYRSSSPVEFHFAWHNNVPVNSRASPWRRTIPLAGTVYYYPIWILPSPPWPNSPYSNLDNTVGPWVLWRFAIV